MKFARAVMLAMVCLSCCAGPAVAQYPANTVTIVVPFGPGGSNDTVARYLAAELTQLWGQPVVVENRPGAGAVIGTNHVARAAPDGHTLLLSSVTFTTTPAVRQNLPYDPRADLAPVAMIGNVPLVLAVGPSIQAKTFEEFRGIARSKELAYGDSGVGSIDHLTAELLSDAVGINLTPVHYKGGTEAMTDLAGGHVDLFFGTVVQLLPMIQSGQLTGLLVTSAVRNTMLPDLPTSAEVGFSEVSVDVWWGIFAPTGTPNEIVRKVNADISAVLATEETREFLAVYGAQPNPLSSNDFTARVQEDLQKWQTIARKKNIRAE